MQAQGETQSPIKRVTARSLHAKRRCEITIISFSRSICRGGLAALIEVTGKPYPSCLSCHSHPIRPCGHLPLEGKAAIREYHLLKKRRRSRHLTPEPNESKLKRSCEEMNSHFFTAPFFVLLTSSISYLRQRAYCCCALPDCTSVH